MFAAAFALLSAVAFADATQVKSVKAGNDPIRQQGNWTLHDIASSALILEDAAADAPSKLSASLILDEFRMQCPYGDHVGALIPVEGASPKQYTLQFVKDDAQLPEGAIKDGWFKTDATDDFSHPDLQKLGNSKVGENGIFDVVEGNFDFPALTWVEKSAEAGEGFEILVDYAHDLTC
ncbi:hypothetical protein K523DRAFT_285004 [Schizophyllum commune Tattone D]|nr:hypothetical protein K523DRAFT_285004 [Schizophyllum commune Tattone D]